MERHTRQRMREAVEILTEAKSKIPRYVGEESRIWMQALQPVCTLLGGGVETTEVGEALALSEQGKFARAVRRLSLKAAWTFSPGRDAQISEDISTVVTCLESVLERTSEEAEQGAVSGSDSHGAPRRVKYGAPDPFYSSMEDLQWGEIAIDFIDGSNVWVEVRKHRRCFDHTEMGFKDDRQGTPNKQWLMLREISKTGELRRPRGETRDKFRARKRALSKALKSHFGIHEDPLPWDRKSGTWIPTFKIRPERSQREFSPPRRIKPSDC